eukprot:1160084-Pelagomonas_calceolata.AAC.1
MRDIPSFCTAHSFAFTFSLPEIASLSLEADGPVQMSSRQSHPAPSHTHGISYNKVHVHMLSGFASQRHSVKLSERHTCQSTGSKTRLPVLLLYPGQSGLPAALSALHADHCPRLPHTAAQ